MNMKKIVPSNSLFSRSFFSLILIGTLLFLVSENAFAVLKTSIGAAWNASGNWSPSGIPIAGDDIVINTNMTSGPPAALTFSSLTVNSGFTLTHTGSAITLSGNLQVDGTYQLTTANLTVNGTTSISGTLNDNNNIGTNRFDGLVTITGTGTISNSANPVFEFRGGITNNGSFTISGTGVTTFSTNNQAIQGNAFTFGAVTVATGITLSSSGSVPVTFNGNLTATGSIDFTGAGTTTLGGMTCSGAGSVILQTLSTVGTTTISQTGTLTVLGSTTTQTVTVSSTIGLKKFTGLFTVSSGTFSSTNAAPLEFLGGITANGNFSQTGAATVTFTGASTISGTGTVAFAGTVNTNNKLTLSKTAGTVAFNGALNVAGIFELSSSTSSTISGVGVVGSMISGAGTSFSIGANNFTVNGTTSIGGLVTDLAVGGIDTFTGAFSILFGGELKEEISVSNSNWVFGDTFSNAGSFTNTSNGATITFNGNVTNTGTFTRTNSTAPIVFNNTIVFSSTNSIAITGGTMAFTVNGDLTLSFGANDLTSGGTLVVNSAGSLAFTNLGLFSIVGTSSIVGQMNCSNVTTVSLLGTVSLSGSGSLKLASTNFTAGAATTLSGTSSITDNNNSGSNLFTGLVTNGAGCSVSTSNNSPFEFQGGITNNGTLFSLTGSGLISFTTNNQTLSGSGTLVLGTVSVPTNTLTNGTTVNISTLSVSSVASYTINGSNTLSVSGATNLDGTMFCATSSTVSLNGALSVTGSLNLSTSTFTAGSITTLSGTGILFDNNNGGSNLFIGLVTVGAGCSFSSGNTSPWEFRNGVFHDGTSFSLTGGGVVSFTTNNQSLSGSSQITINSVSIDNISLTNNGTVTFTACNGTTGSSNLVQGVSADLTYKGATLMTTGTLSAGANGNTVTYGNGSQTIQVPSSIYFNLATSTSGTKTAGGNLTVANSLTVGVSTTFQASTFDLNLNTVSLIGTFQKNGAGNIVIEGVVTTSGAGIFSGMTGAPTIEFQGGIVHNSTNGTASNLGAGIVTFTTNNQSLTGSPTAGFTFGGDVLIASGIEITNVLALVTIVGNLDGEAGSSKWINNNGLQSAPNGFCINGPNPPFNSFGTLDASTNVNTVNYNRSGVQTIRSMTYHRLLISGSSNKTISDITINENFTQSGGTLVCSNTQTMTSSAAASLTVTSGSLSNLVIAKTGSSVTLASNVTTNGELTITAGTLIFGGTARTFTVNEDLNGGGSLDMTGASHNLNLKGEFNSIGSLTSNSGSTVTYNRSGNQSIFESSNYANMTLGGSGIKSLSGTTITVAGTLNFSSNLFLSLDNSNLILGPLGALAGTFSANRMIITNGYGLFIKEGTTTANFTAFNAGAGLYPLGTTGFYSPFTISSLTATISGTGSIAMRAVPSKQPNVPYYNNSLVKYWELQSTNLSAISASMNFSFQVGEVIGNQALYEARVWNGSSLVAPNSPSAPGSNPFSTTGSTIISGSWTAIDPAVRNAFYSYQTGNWTDLNTWTTDPSGSTLIGSAIPSSGDQVYILNGRTITIGGAVTIASLNIANGGILDVGSTSGHTFGPISGEGLLRLSTTSIPTGNYTQFVASSGGTIEYYNIAAGTSVMDNTLGTYNNLIVSSSNATSFIVAQDHILSLNGNFSLVASSSGVPTFAIGNSTTNQTLNIGGNLTVGAGAQLNVGVFNAAHRLNLTGNLTNSGTISLTNGAANVATSNGYCVSYFGGLTTNTTLTCTSGSNTKLHQVFVTKNTGYELYITAAAGVSPLFWANGETIKPISGTLHLGTNIEVPVLTTSGGNYDLGSPTNNPTFWIDGANVTYYAGGGAIVPYGTLKVSAGSFTNASGQSAIVLRETGQLILEGGTINAQMFRTSTSATTHRGSFIMSGGTLNLNVASGGGIGFYSIFTLPYPDNVFKMSGGTINISRTTGGGITPNGGIQIASKLGNYEVTGGDVNVTIKPSATYNFDISTAAPLYNLTINRSAGVGGLVRLNSIAWSYDGGAGNTVTYPAQPLVVLNNFTINGANSPIFDALNSNVTVGGNMVINSGGTFQSTSQTLIFNGAGAQTFTQSGSLGTGLSSLTIDKPGSTLTIAGTAGTITTRQDLTITAGTLADGGKTINVAGNIINNGVHSGAGKIALNSSSTSQTIGGTGTSVFGNLDFSNTNGAAGTTQITASSNLQVNGNLGLTTDRVAKIGNRQIILSATSSITGTFGVNRHIKTNGLLSDGGIKKTFSSTAAFVFPVGYGTNYSPATIQFTSAPTTWGSLDVRPVGNKQLYVTDPDCFDLYWKIKTNGFTGIPANSVNYTYNYGNLIDNTSYIPAFYDQMAIAFVTINNVAQVNEATNDIYFTGVSYTDGDYTAGAPIAFGIVTPYYSRADGDWNTPATWSNTSHGGLASATIPASNSPVLVGDGSTYFHTVTITTNGTISGSVIVDAGSTLDCQTTTGNNFGAIPYATSGGSGTIKISSAVATAEFPAGDFGLFFETEGGTCDYYSTGSQDFTIPTNTNAPNAISIGTYKNLTIRPGNGRKIIFPNKDLRIYDLFKVDGHSNGGAMLTDASSRTLTLDANVDILNGSLVFGPSFSQTISAEGNINIQGGGKLETKNSGSIVHSITLKGNLFNEGTISLNNASKAALNFQGNTNSLFYGSNGSASASLFQVTVDKGVSTATELEVTMAGTLTTPTNDWLNLVNGNLKISKGTTMTLTDQAGFNFIIPNTAGLTLNHASLSILVGQVNSPLADLLVNGKLKIAAGTLEIGDVANNQNNDLEYGSAGFPEIEIIGNGVLNVNGQIRRPISSQQGSVLYTQSGNSQVLVRGKNSDPGTSLTYDKGKFEVLNPGSVFNMSGNSVLTISRQGLVSGIYYDIYLQPENYSVTGGEVRIGNSSTPASQVFFMSSSFPFWDLSVDGTTTTKTLSLVANPVSVLHNFRIEANSVFNTNGLDLTIGGDFVNQNTTATSGLAVGGFRAVNASQVTTFNGSAGSQTISGVAGNLTNFSNLNIVNTFPSGDVTLAGNTNTRVSGQLNITSGLFNTATNTCTVLGNVSNDGGHTASVSGYLVFSGSVKQFINSSTMANFGNIRINNGAGIDLNTPVNLNGDLNFVSGLFYINNYKLTLGLTSTVTGSLNSSSMIRINGVASDGGVTKLYPASAHDFTFPVGVTLKYTPVRFNVTSNSVAGTINLKPVNTRHPATTDPLAKELIYYWKVASTGFNGSTVVNQTYNYVNLDVNGTELSYVTGRFFASAWTPTFGIASTVDALNHRFTLTGVNYFDGDYTAGESTEFNILKTFYSLSATLGGNWNLAGSWSDDQLLKHAGAPAATIPNFNPIEIAAGHTITVTANGYNTVSALLDGNLALDNTIGHNLGTVSGTGTISQTPTAANQYLFPGGDYSAFVSPTGGTFEFGGAVNGTLSTQTVYNNLLFSGSAVKSLPNANLVLSGNLGISGGQMDNPNNKDISLAGNWTNLVGVGGFSPGTGSVILNGSAQSLSGGTDFYRLQTNGAGVKTLTSSQSVTNNLTLTSGIIQTGGNLLTVNSGATVTGGSAGSHIQGNLRKGIAASTASTNFEIGDGTVYTPVSVNYTGTTVAGGFITANTTNGDHPDIYLSGIDQVKSANRFWTLTNSGVTGFTGYSVRMNYNSSDLDGAANPLAFVVGQYNGTVWSLPTVGTLTATSGQATGISGTVFGDFQLGQPVDGKIWTGATNTNWNLAGNWIPTTVPTSSDNAIIGGVTNQPNFTSGSNGQCKKLVLYSGANPTIPSGYTLTINDNIESTTNTINGVGDLVVNGSPSVLSGSLTINCNLQIPITKSLSLGAGSTLNVGQNLDVAGSLIHNNLPVNFTGNNPSLLSGNLSFYDLVIQKTASTDAVTLGSNATVSNSLDMQTGDLELNGRELDLGATGNLINESEANSVTGRTGGQIKATRNLNNPASNNVGGLGAEITSSANLGSTEITRRHNQVVFGFGFGGHRVYGIHPTNNSALDATLVYNYFEHELNTDAGAILEADLDLWRFNGISWDRQFAAVNMAANTLTKTNIPQFSDWTDASYINNPLALSLKYFEVSCKNNKPVAVWKTAKESENQWFVLEASADGRDWVEVSKTSGAGNSDSELGYQISLTNLGSNARQVRLVAIDIHGVRSILPTRAIFCEFGSKEIQAKIYPNPTDGQVFVEFTPDSAGIAEVRIINVLGQILGFQSVDVQRHSTLSIDLGGLPAGIYSVQISQPDSHEKPKTHSIILR